ncbi:TGS domain-containing protein [Enterococcus sp. 669A]|uniref:TGS domain-containing protein n=1 Tax=Candidatus Enterococcus moelleringii TaxID=2815325 RepID=A0ABS3L9N3_9ENTE|nr:TGS domain-containing protein [Enterococcus sp. 669A]MBO1306302.1 TGS domain-containing protein [Enterococcus sp. 669A]
MNMNRDNGINYMWSTEDSQSLFKDIRTVLKRRNNYTSILYKTFVFGEDHHYQKRLTGESIFCHGLRAGLILAQAGFEPEYILLAMLKDVVRKGTATEDEIRQNYYPKLAEEILILNKDPKKINKMNHGRTDYIVLASRLDNLRTMDMFDSDRQIAKIEHTKNVYLKIATKRNSEFFVSRIEDAFFYVENPLEYQRLATKQNNLLSSNTWAIQKAKSLLSKLEKSTEVHKITMFKTLPITIKQFSEAQKKAQSKIIYIPTCDIKVVIKEEFVWNTMPIFLKLFQEKLASKSWHILNFFTLPDQHDPDLEESFFLVEDSFGLYYRLIVEGENHYLETQRGLLKAPLETVSNSKSDSNTINIFLPDGLKVEMHEGSTILDAAFRIHEYIGFHAVNATINGSENPIDLSTPLIENWTVKINTDAEPQVTPAWITKVRTKKALAALADYFERTLNS